MKTPLIVAVFSFALVPLSAHTQAVVPAQPPVPVAKYGQLPLSFEANQGQTDPQVRFTSRGSGYSLFLTDSAAVLSLTRKETSATGPSHRDVVRMELAGASHGIRITGADQLPGMTNYFIGNDSSKWRSNVATFAKVKYSGVYPGIDLVYYGNQRQLEYDFIVAPGADAKRVQLHFAGADKLRINADGDLTISASNGEIAFHKPVVYQAKDGQRHPVAGSFKLLAKNTVAFSLGEYDHSRELVIDPTLAYSTYLGGYNDGYFTAIAVDAAGNAYVTGATIGNNQFPITSGAFQNTAANSPQAVGFVSKLNAAGTALVYSTYVSGTYGSSPTAIAVDGSGNAYLTGTNYSNFPITPGAFQQKPASGFVTKLNPTGSALVYSTYLGGSGGDSPSSIAVDASGHAYVTGWTSSYDFPVSANAYQKTNKVTNKQSVTGFVTEMSADGSALVFSTYLGGTGGTEGPYNGDLPRAIAVDSSNSAYVGGSTTSTNFPTTSGGFQTIDKNTKGFTGFVTKFNPGGSTLAYSTYLGGSGESLGYPDVVYAIAVDNGGKAYAAGSASSTDFPTTPGAFQTVNSTGAAFVTKINADGGSLAYSTFVGASKGATALGIAVDQNGQAVIAGYTGSPNYPVTTNAFQTVNKALGQSGDPTNAFLTQLNSTGSALIYSTYLGGTGQSGYGELTYGLALDGLGNAYITGDTWSADFPVTPGAFQSFDNSQDPYDPVVGFISKFALHGATTTTLATSGNSVAKGTNVTLTASVATVGGGAVPSGIVAFLVNGKTTNETLDGNGHATYSTTSLPAGQNTIIASYLGDPGVSSSSSAVLTETILGTVVAPPVFSPGSGLYPSGTDVTLTSATPGAVIRYTTDGSAPNAYSAVYSQPIPVADGTNLIIRAVASATGQNNSASSIGEFVTEESYDINYGSDPNDPYASPLPTVQSSTVFNGSATLNGGTNYLLPQLRLTDGGVNEAGSAFYAFPIDIQAFTTDFIFQIANPVADGFTFTIQNAGPTAVGGNGAGLGYVSIHKSVAIKFDIYNNDGEGNNSTGIYTAGNVPTVPSITLAGTGINLRGGHSFAAHITYDGTNLILTLTDQTTKATWSHTFPIDIPATVHGDTAYVGFTGGTGGGTSLQSITSWTYTAGQP